MGEGIWIIVAQSCPDCRSTVVRAVSREPKSDELAAVAAEAGRMNCIVTRAVWVEIDGEAREVELHS